jgi:hypothetical protein
MSIECPMLAPTTLKEEKMCKAVLEFRPEIVVACVLP